MALLLRRSLLWPLAGLAVLLLVRCNSGHDYVYNHKNLYLMSLPSRANQEHFLLKGGTAVIELVKTGERSDLVKIAGLKYFTFTWDEKTWLTKSQLTEIATKTSTGATTLIHSSNTNHAAAWLAAHFVTQRQYSTDEALSEAKKAGLTDDWQKNVKTYIEKLQKN